MCDAVCCWLFRHTVHTLFNFQILIEERSTWSWEGKEKIHFFFEKSSQFVNRVVDVVVVVESNYYANTTEEKKIPHIKLTESLWDVRQERRQTRRMYSKYVCAARPQQPNQNQMRIEERSNENKAKKGNQRVQYFSFFSLYFYFCFHSSYL